MLATSRLPLLAALYVLSGAAALMLEVGWARLLGLHLGHTTGATSTILAAFMGGLALGSLAGGRLARCCLPGQALRAFAVAELTVAAVAPVVPLLLAAADPLLAYAYADGDGSVAFGVLRLAICVLVLLLPTTAMGAGYPLLVRAASAAPGRSHAGWLYAANTAGASVGAVLAGFVLLPLTGLRWTTAAAGGLDVLVGVAAWWLARSATPIPARAPASRSGPADGMMSAPWLALATTALLGLISMGVQVAWTRVLALIVGPTTYAFSALLGVWIAGVAVGAMLGTWAARSRAAAGWLGVSALAVAAAVVGAMVTVDPLVLAAGRAAAQSATSDLVFWRPLTAALVLVGPTSLFLGAAFPLALALAGPGDEPRHVGWAYGANTVGGIVGALLAGYVLVPQLGLQSALRVLAMSAAVCGLAVLGRTRLARSQPARWQVLVAGGLLVAIGVGLTDGGWTPQLLASGAYRYVPSGADEDLEAALLAGEVPYLREGAAATVAIRRLAGTTSLVIDGKPDASTAGDMLTQKLLGHLPLLLHDRPRRVCVIGLGSGVTVGAVLRHPVAQVDVVEIAPEVVAASRYFEAEHGGALADPRTRLLVTDARTHLRLARATYDVIVSEPSNPWMAGVASLFTRQFLESVRARLAPGGIFCQWAHTYDMSEHDLRSILATFHEVFPEAGVWLVGEADLLLIGGVGAAPASTGLAAALRRPGVLDDLRAVEVTGGADLSSLQIADTAGLARLAAGASVQDDDRLALEFSAPHSLALRSGTENLAWLRGQYAGDGPASREEWSSRGRMLARAEAWSLGYEALSRAVASGAADDATLEAFARAAAGAGRLIDAVTVLRASLGASEGAADDSRRRAALARLLAAQGDPAAALAVVAPLPRPDPVRLRAAAAVVADAGDADTLAAIVSQLTQVDPAHADTGYFAATASFLRGDLAAAEAAALTAAATHPDDARVQNLLGATLATQGRHAEAGVAFARARRLDPDEAGTYVNSGRLAEAEGRHSEASRLYAEALAIDASLQSAREGLRRLRTSR